MGERDDPFEHPFVVSGERRAFDRARRDDIGQGLRVTDREGPPAGASPRYTPAAQRRMLRLHYL